MKTKLDKLLETIEIKPEDLRSVQDKDHPDEIVGLVHRSAVHMTREFGDVVLSEFDNIDVDGAPIIESFPSIGLVGVLTGKQIVKTLKLPLIGVLRLEHFQSACVVSHEQPSYPARIYGNKQLVVFLCEMAFRVPPDAMGEVVQAIYDFAHRHRSQMIYALEGMPKPQIIQLPTGEEVEIRLNRPVLEEDGEENDDAGPTEENSMLIDDSILAKLTVRERLKEKEEEAKTNPPAEKVEEKKTKKKKRKGRKSEGNELEQAAEPGIEKIADKLFGDKLHYVTTNHSMARQLRSLGHIPVVDGILPGVVGALVAEAPLRSTPDVTALLVPTSTVLPDPDSAIHVLRLLDTLLPDIGLDKAEQELDKDVASLRKMLQGLMKNLSADLRKDGANLRRSMGGVPHGMYQ